MQQHSPQILFLIQSDSVCLLIGELNPLAIKVLLRWTYLTMVLLVVGLVDWVVASSFLPSLLV